MRLWDVESLIEKACEEESPFYDHLRALDSRISRRAEWGLDNALRRIIAGDSTAGKRTIGLLLNAPFPGDKSLSQPVSLPAKRRNC